jgi:CheY-specific phosphatase CheX
MPQKIPQKLQDMVLQGVKEFFLANGVKELKDGYKGLSPSEYQWTGIIGFGGDLIRGSFSVTCKAGLLDHTHPNLAMGIPIDDADRVDWIGEVANQILGRIKNLTIDYSVNFALSAPSVVRGQSLEVVGQDRRMISTIHMFADDHPVTVTMICVINPNFNFDKAQKTARSKHAAEGESLLF